MDLSWLECLCSPYIQCIYVQYIFSVNASDEVGTPAIVTLVATLLVYAHTPVTALLVDKLFFAEQRPLGGVAPPGEQRLRPPRIELRAECRETQSRRPLALAIAAALC